MAVEKYQALFREGKRRFGANKQET